MTKNGKRVLVDESAKLRDENAALRAQLESLLAKGHKPRTLGIKLSTTTPGCIQLTGLRRVPWAFYRDELRQVVAPEFVAKIKQFLDDNVAELDRVQKAYDSRKNGIAPTAPTSA